MRESGRMACRRGGWCCAAFVLLVFGTRTTWAASAETPELRDELKGYEHGIVYETRRDGHWELCRIDADGSNATLLTRTPQPHELYPHVSPDGTKVCFSVDEGEGNSKVRSVYCMNVDGSDRKLVAKNARQACWKSDGTAIAYLKGEFEKFNYMDYATKGIYFHDMKTGADRQHPNEKIHHLYNLCWSPDGKWFVATVHGGMGFKHAILAIAADGPGVYNLGIHGCRPDFSPDGKRITWGASDWVLMVADLDLSGPKPKLTNKRSLVRSVKPIKIYHTDWSPDGRYIAFSRGPSKKRLGFAPEMVGIPAEGWNICVADAKAKDRWVQITSDGKCNKEPDWAPVRKTSR